MKSIRAHSKATVKTDSDHRARPRRRPATRGRSRPDPGRSGSGQTGPEAVRPPVPTGRTVTVDPLASMKQAFIFDVEGTLVDSVLARLQCWSETLGEIGQPASVADLHPFSGMDGRRMLRRVLSRHDPKLLDHVVQLAEQRFRERYLPHVRPFRGLRRLFTAITQAGGRIALASPCSKDEFAHYRTIMNVEDLVEVAFCAEEVKRDKPSVELVGLAVRKLRLPPDQIAMVGDTPGDADAARAAGLVPIGLQGGHFSRSDLLDAGYAAVFFDLQALAARLEEHKPAAAAESADQLKSHTAATAESR